MENPESDAEELARVEKELEPPVTPRPKLDWRIAVIILFFAAGLLYLSFQGGSPTGQPVTPNPTPEGSFNLSFGDLFFLSCADKNFNFVLDDKELGSCGCHALNSSVPEGQIKLISSSSPDSQLVFNSTECERLLAIFENKSKGGV